MKSKDLEMCKINNTKINNYLSPIRSFSMYSIVSRYHHNEWIYVIWDIAGLDWLMSSSFLLDLDSTCLNGLIRYLTFLTFILWSTSIIVLSYSLYLHLIVWEYIPWNRSVTSYVQLTNLSIITTTSTSSSSSIHSFISIHPFINFHELQHHKHQIWSAVAVSR